MKYFKHDLNCRDDDKIFELIEVHGMQGYGIWWSILEELYQSEDRGFQITVSDTWFKRLSKTLNLSDWRTLLRTLDTMAEIGLIDRQLWGEHIIYAPGLAKRADDYILKKRQATERKREQRRKEKDAISALESAYWGFGSQGVTEENRLSGVSHAGQVECHTVVTTNTDTETESRSRDQIQNLNSKIKDPPLPPPGGETIALCCEFGIAEPETVSQKTKAIPSVKPEGQDRDKKSSARRSRRKATPAADVYASLADQEGFDKFWSWILGQYEKSPSKPNPGIKARAAEAWRDRIEASEGELDRLRLAASYSASVGAFERNGIPHVERWLRDGHYVTILDMWEARKPQQDGDSFAPVVDVEIPGETNIAFHAWLKEYMQQWPENRGAALTITHVRDYIARAKSDAKKADRLQIAWNGFQEKLAQAERSQTEIETYRPFGELSEEEKAANRAAIEKARRIAANASA